MFWFKIRTIIRQITGVHALTKKNARLEVSLLEWGKAHARLMNENKELRNEIAKLKATEIPPILRQCVISKEDNETVYTVVNQKGSK